ncbi:MAG: hypothetical protein LBR80_10465 [Deltaproteobacteria bacterium]|nr:hypothetical protein [Deltaproteobacteria bacterium]
MSEILDGSGGKGKYSEGHSCMGASELVTAEHFGEDVAGRFRVLAGNPAMNILDGQCPLEPDSRLTGQILYGVVRQLIQEDCSVAREIASAIGKSGISKLASFIAGERVCLPNGVVDLIRRGRALNSVFKEALSRTCDDLERFVEISRPIMELDRNGAQMHDIEDLRKVLEERKARFRNVIIRGWDKETPIIQGLAGVAGLFGDTRLELMELIAERAREYLLWISLGSDLDYGSGIQIRETRKKINDSVALQFLKFPPMFRIRLWTPHGDIERHPAITVAQDIFQWLCIGLSEFSQELSWVLDPSRICLLLKISPAAFMDENLLAMVDSFVTGDIYFGMTDRIIEPYRLTSCMFHEGMHWFQGICSDLARLGSKGALLFLEEALRHLGIQRRFDPGKTSTWYRGNREDKLAELFSRGCEKSLRQDLTGPQEGGIDRANWKMLQFPEHVKRTKAPFSAFLNRHLTRWSAYGIQ